jgi:hypothetical protein
MPAGRPISTREHQASELVCPVVQTRTSSSSAKQFIKGMDALREVLEIKKGLGTHGKESPRAAGERWDCGARRSGWVQVAKPAHDQWGFVGRGASVKKGFAQPWSQRPHFLGQ